MFLLGGPYKLADDLNLNQLKAFYVAAACGSITLAAEKMFITQPAVSMQIKAMEAHYGVRLFLRGKKKLELTEAGQRLYEVSKKIFSLVLEAEQLLLQAKEFATDVLKIGSTKTLLRYLLAPYISKFQESFPKVQIQIDEGSSEEMVQSVLDGGNDLALVGRLPYGEKIKVIPFTQDELVLLAAPGHRLCEQERVSVKDLAGENVILREKGSGTRRLVEEVLAGTSIVSSSFVETGNVDFIKELVRIGNGITMLARMGVDQDVSKGHLKILPLVEGPFILYCDIVINKEKPLPKATEAFLNLLMKGQGSGSRYEGNPVLPDVAAADTVSDGLSLKRASL